MRFASSERRSAGLAIAVLFVSLGCRSAESATVPASPVSTTRDVVVYGGTSAGVMAAVQVARMNRSVLLIDPDGRLGGLSSGGLGATDVGNEHAIGGLSREFYRRVARHYDDESAWRQEPPRTEGLRRGTDGETMWAFEPHVALDIFDGLLAELPSIDVWRGERLDRSEGGLAMDGARITQLVTESGRIARGSVFIDATYEGDLMALAGVSYVVGREGEAEFGEKLNGIRTELATHHQFVPGVDPYVVAGDPTSGLLPRIDPSGPGDEGGGDARVQAYCLRMCTTDHPDNRLPWTRPDDYDALEYELLLRNFDAGADRAPWHPVRMPNRKTDTNNNRGFSTDFIGASYGWAEASYDERAEIYREHLTYQRGLMWTLANHERVPKAIRDEITSYGPCRDEFTDNGGWSPQLYVREARRMRSDTIVTQHHCVGDEVAPQPVGLAAYTMDSHHVQRYVDANGHVRNEGDVQVRVPRPYALDYGAIRPRKNECTNLLVTCCPSASHIAFGSLRMEPVFMVLGQSAATAACHAIDEDAAVQDVNWPRLRARLEADGQILEPPPVPASARPAGLDPASFDGIVIDDETGVRVGFGSESTSVPPFVSRGYRHDGNDGKGSQRVTFDVAIPEAGTYELQMAWTPHANRASNVPISLRHAGGNETATLDQRAAPAEAPFGPVGRWRLDAGTVTITVRNDGTDGYVIVDALRLVATD